jgi:hypothetical protein
VVIAPHTELFPAHSACLKISFLVELNAGRLDVAVPFIGGFLFGEEAKAKAGGLFAGDRGGVRLWLGQEDSIRPPGLPKHAGGGFLPVEWPYVAEPRRSRPMRTAHGQRPTDSYIFAHLNETVGLTPHR